MLVGDGSVVRMGRARGRSLMGFWVGREWWFFCSDLVEITVLCYFLLLYLIHGGFSCGI